MQEHGQQGVLACRREKPGQVSCEQETTWPWFVHGGHAWQTRAWEKEEPAEQTRGMQVGGDVLECICWSLAAFMRKEGSCCCSLVTPGERKKIKQAGEAHGRCRRERNELLVGIAGAKGDVGVEEPDSACTGRE